MTMKMLNSGIYPAMLTPYNKDGSVDVGCLHALTKWYAEKGCQGVFAACLSSEIYALPIEDRVLIARETVKAAPDSMDVVVSGHTTAFSDKAIEELKAMADTGAKALVLISPNIAAQDEDDDVYMSHIETIMKEIPDIDLGIYECPAPYMRQVSPELLGKLAATDRFVFMKDTSCSAVKMKEKLDAVKGSRLKIFNANTTTFLQTVKDGAAGHCGILSNLHPDLYVKVFELAQTDMAKAEELMDIIGAMSNIRFGDYATNVKIYQRMEGLPYTSVRTREKDNEIILEDEMYEMEQRLRFTNRLRKEWL